MSGQKQINVGKISGAFGIKGWLKVFSYTDPEENILHYSPWLLKKKGISKTVKPIGGKLQGRFVVVQVDGVIDRDQAADMAGWDICITSDQLPDAEEGEYYWSDLIGLNVENLQGVHFGMIESILATGANDVLIIRGDRERAVPFLQGQTVIAIDLSQGKMKVDWDAEF